MEQENGGTNLNVLKNMYPFYLGSKDYPAIIIYPQCPSNVSWLSVASKVKGIIDYSIANYNVDKDKVALTGFSWGGSGAWEIGLQYPTLFSCIVPVSGYNSKSATTYPDCPVWGIGSTGDGSSKHTETIGQLLKSAGKKVKVDIYSNAHTGMPQIAYTQTLINWMIERSRATNSRYNF